MLGATLIRLSRSTTAQRIATEWGFVRRAARRFVAGETLEEAVQVVKGLNAGGFESTLDFLGENTSREAEATACTQEYLRLLDRIGAEKLRSHVSLKPTQLGLDLDENLCLRNLRQVVERAGELGTFVRMDMEGSACTERTLRVFERLRGVYEGVGAVLQAYLYRSAGDLERLLRRQASVRLCKGAYREPVSVAYASRREVDRNYIKLAERLLRAAAEGRAHAALATHDPRIVRWAELHARRSGLGPSQFEFQMLYGIRRDLQRRLLQDGFRVRIYVSYGTHWYPFFMRRMAERPANVIFVLKNLFR